MNQNAGKIFPESTTPVILAAIDGTWFCSCFTGDYTARFYGAESEDVSEKCSETVIENASNESVEEPETRRNLKIRKS